MLLANKRFLGNINVLLRRRHEMLTYQAPAFVEYIAGLGVSDAVLSGDFTSTSTDAEFRSARAFVESLHRAGLRPVAFPGNHDVYTFESTRTDRFGGYLGDWMPAPTLPALRTLPGGVTMLFVPTVCPNLISSRGRIHTEEIHQVQELLATVTGPLVIAGHYPLLDGTYGYEMTPQRRLRGAKALRDALSTFPGKMLYVSGHVHRFSYVTDPTVPNLAHLTTGALFRRDRAAGHTGDFSEVRVGTDGFRVVRHRFNEGWQSEEHAPRAADPAACPTF